MQASLCAGHYHGQLSECSVALIARLSGFVGQQKVIVGQIFSSILLKRKEGSLGPLFVSPGGLPLGASSGSSREASRGAFVPVSPEGEFNMSPRVRHKRTPKIPRAVSAIDLHCGRPAAAIIGQPTWPKAKTMIHLNLLAGWRVDYPLAGWLDSRESASGAVTRNRKGAGGPSGQE